METYVSQRPENSKRNDGRIMTRAVAAGSRENMEKSKIGPPAKKSGAQTKTVTFSEPEAETPRPDKGKEDLLKSKSHPYVDVPPIKPALQESVIDPVREDQITKFGPVYKSRAPVEMDVDIEELVARVLELEVSVPLRNLAGVSAAIQKEIRKQVTKSRISVEIDKKTCINHLDKAVYKSICKLCHSRFTL